MIHWMNCRLLVALCGVLIAGCALAAPHEHAHDAPKIEKPIVFLDKSPRIVAFQLARLPDAQLLLVDREPTHLKYIPVYEAILLRPAIPANLKQDAVTALAKINKSDATAEILGALKRLPEDQSALAVGLAKLLLDQPAAALKKQLAALQEIAGDDNPAAVRQAAFAALAATQPADGVWSFAEEKMATPHLLIALPLVPDAAVRAAFYAKTAPLLQASTDAPLRRAAVAAVARMPGHEAAAFAALAALVAADADAADCARAITAIPKSQWPAARLQPLANDLLTRAKAIPQSQRTENDYLDIAQLGLDLAAKLPRETGAPIRQAFAVLGVNVLRLRTLHEQMLFDRALLVVEAGRPVEVFFENTDAMPHNWVLAAIGAADAVGAAAEKMTPKPDALGRVHVPDSPQVLQASRMLNLGERARIAFTAPKVPGDYPFLCTFPGHWQRMRGVLKVVGDMETYLAQNPTAPVEIKITEWKSADFAAALTATTAAGDPARGKAVFAKAACASCHQLGAEGVAFGPNLSDSIKRLKGDGLAMLTEILEPSRTIDEKYRNYNFDLTDDETVNGLILKEDAAGVTLRTGPGEAQVQTLPKKMIKTRRPSALSLMPAGLLNTLAREEVLDLLAYLRTANAPARP